MCQKIAILGYGKEGQSAERWLRKRYPEAEIAVLDNFKIDELAHFGLGDFDLIVRTPSVSPLRIKECAPNTKITSITKIFFDQCPCQIIGITGTKGKGTTASLISQILEKIGKKVWLVGNIGVPALEVLSEIKPDDIAVYELSSFQLWDLEISPKIAVVLRVEPDHLNVHHGYEDYVNAKSNIAKHQTPENSCIYYIDNPDSVKIAKQSKGNLLGYPIQDPLVQRFTNKIQIPGEHIRENAEAALLAVAAALNMSLPELLAKYDKQIIKALQEFKGLPHRLELVREIRNVKYYDDSFSSAFPALSVAIDTFSNSPTVIIAGGLDRGLDLTKTKQKLFRSKNIKKVILIGETAPQLAENESTEQYEIVKDLSGAVKRSQFWAEQYPNSIVVLSPGAASFDMFENFVDRGEKFQKLVKELR